MTTTERISISSQWELDHRQRELMEGYGYVRDGSGNWVKPKAPKVPLSDVPEGFWIYDDGGLRLAIDAGLTVSARIRSFADDVGNLTIFEYGPKPFAEHWLATRDGLEKIWQDMVANRNNTDKWVRTKEWMAGYGERRLCYPAEVIKAYCNERWTWTPISSIGSGTKLHLRPDELDFDCLARITKSMVPVLIRPEVLGVHVYSGYNPCLWDGNNRYGERAVYGYWTK